MDTLRKEYDCFGPWLLEIKSQEEVPPLFRVDYNYGNKVKFAFKIPINVERRNTTLGSILYDSVISLYEDQLFIFNRINTAVSSRAIRYSEILFIQNMRDLLCGALKIFISGEVVTIKYNTVSDKIINHMIDFIRLKYTYENTKEYKLPYMDEIPVMIPVFTSLWIQMVRKEQIALLNYQPMIQLSSNKKSWLQKVFAFRYRRELQGGIFLNSEKELIIISRKNCIKRSCMPDFSYMHTYMPLTNIDDIKIKDNDEFGILRNVIIQSGKYNVVFQIEEHLCIEDWMHVIKTGEAYVGK